jgi:hypothetical protein
VTSADREQILESVARGELSPEEGNALLKALQRPAPRWWRRVFAPMETLSLPTALGISLLAAGVAVALSRFGVRFDGALDTHLVHHDLSWATAAADLFVSWPLVALLFWAASRVARQGRLVDHLAAVGVARVPLVAAGAVAALLRDQLPRAEELVLEGGQPVLEPGQLAAALFFGLVVALPMLGFFIVLLLTGFRTASGLRGARLAVTFIVTLVVAEVLSKLLLALL